MSIYTRNRGGWREQNDVVQPIARPHAAPGLSVQPRPDADRDWSSVRKARPAEYLLPLTEKWFDAFPSDKAPCALATQYPRICNLIAVHWNDMRGAPELFEDLLTDRRGGRAGFPPAVRRDLISVQEQWYSGQIKL
jgi:hypothetical protein